MKIYFVLVLQSKNTLGIITTAVDNLIYIGGRGNGFILVKIKREKNPRNYQLISTANLALFEWNGA